MSAYARKVWEGRAGTVGRVVSSVLTPPSWLYGACVAARNRTFDVREGERVPGLRVVSVGNLAVGGTGKTPFAAWVARELAAFGRRTVILTRGTGGDEVALHRRWNPGVPVVVGGDRVASARTARSDGAEVAVLDDGFQHRKLAREVDVVLLAAEDPFPGRLLPAGPYREPARALGRADVVVVTRRTAPREQAAALLAKVQRRAPSAVLGQVAFELDGWASLDGERATAPVGSVMAACAIARPADFEVAVARALGRTVQGFAFPDHYAYAEADVQRMRVRAGSATLVVTEKDAVKLQPFEAALGSVRVAIQRMVWEQGRVPVTQAIIGEGGR